MSQDCADLLSCAADPASRERIRRFIRSNIGRRIYIPSAGTVNSEALSMAVHMLNTGSSRAEATKRIAALFTRSRRWAYAITARALNERRNGGAST